MARRVIQLATLPGFMSATTSNAPTAYALCDDGSVWAINDMSRSWQSISTKGIREGVEIGAPLPSAVAPAQPSPSRSMKKGKAK